MRASILCVVAAAAAATVACDAGDLLLEPAGMSGRRRAASDTVVVGRPGDAISLDPARITDKESVEVINQIYDNLIRFRPGSNQIEPGLATSWEVTDEGKVWTFHLRHGVTFHDGTPFDADAVVFSLDRQRNPKHPFHRGDFAYWESNYRNIEKVEALDAYTVRITIERSYAPFEANMAMFPVAIVSPTAVETWGDDYGQHPVGTGPFRFVAWVPGERIVLERNTGYFEGPPTIQRLVFQSIPDGRQRLVALESGAIDIAYSILPEELQFVELHPSLVLHTTAANNVAYLAMNTTRPPFDDVRVRQAANYAVNKEPIAKLIYQGQAIVADGALPPTQWGYHQVAEPYDYRPDIAQQLLAEATAEGRFDPSRTYTMYVPGTPRPYLPDPEQIARVLQTNLGDVGIHTQIVVQDFAAHLATVQAGLHDTCLLGWVGDNGDPDNFLYVLFDRDNAVPGLARNVAFFQNAELHGLLIYAQESENRDDRAKYYARAQDLIHEQAPWVPLAHTRVAVAARADLGGIVISPSNFVYYNRVFRRAR